MALAPSTTKKRLASIASDVAALQQLLQGRQALGIEVVATCPCCAGLAPHGGADTLRIVLGCDDQIPPPIDLPDEDGTSEGADDILSRLGIKR